MIQQPMYQDLSETPELQQQMMLCPVRVVYDTQMFMQQGEQVQQNQYIINPQNPPPWIQNQVQNQVIYVQNVPNNYIQSYQQHIDPNQFQTYGYNVPQMLVQAPQDPRLQMIPANLVPNINVNQRALAQNIGPMANTLMISEVQNQNVQLEKQIVTNEIMNSEINKPQDISNQTINHQMSIFQAEPKLQIQQQLPVISNIQQRLPQIDQNNIQIRQIHPQVVTPNLQQNYQTIIPQKFTANIQQNYQNIVPQKLPTNLQPNFQTIVSQKVPPMKTNYQVVGGNGQPIYKAIHPRPFNNQPVQQVPSQNIVYMNSIKRNNANNAMSTQNIIPNFVKIDSSRKRKSESPEEIHNKVVISNPNNIVIKEEPISKPVVEIISNPTPVSRNENKIIVNSLQITPLDRETQYPKIKEELAKPIKPLSLMEPKQMIRKKMINNVEAIQNLSNINVQDKLIRNTVYTQARGRLITEQEPVKIASQPNATQTPNFDSKVNTNLAKSENNDSKLSEEKTEMKDNNIEERKEIKDTEDTEEVKTENVDNTRVKDEKSFLLTHVLDGYVIQESNMAFPIRRPLKEKTLRMSSEVIDPKREPKFELPKVHENTKRESERLLDISQLHLKEDKPAEPSESEKGNPFTNVDPNNVKSWTVDELSKHLTKFGWEESISHLQDHEIDGESLFLVSKAQLTRIGISEEHASMICDFVKKI